MISCSTTIPALPLGWRKGTSEASLKLRASFTTSPTPPPAAAQTGPIVLQRPDTSDRLEYRDYLDQTVKGHFTLLAPNELSDIRKRYETLTGAPVEGEARPSDEQLSALSHRLRPQANGRREAPFVEFAVFGLFDGRSTKLRQFHDHILTRDGSWQYRLLRGPSCFAQWEASWRVFGAACVMLDVARPGQFQLYFAGIRRLHDFSLTTGRRLAALMRSFAPKSGRVCTKKSQRA